MCVSVDTQLICSLVREKKIAPEVNGKCQMIIIISVVHLEHL